MFETRQLVIRGKSLEASENEKRSNNLVKKILILDAGARGAAISWDAFRADAIMDIQHNLV